MAVSIAELRVLHTGGDGVLGRYDDAGFVGFSGNSIAFRLLDDDPFVFAGPEGRVRPVGATDIAFDDDVPLRDIEQTSISVVFDGADIRFGTLADSFGVRLDVLRFVTDAPGRPGQEAHAFLYRLGAEHDGVIAWDSFVAAPPPADLRWSDFLSAPIVGTLGRDRLEGAADANRMLGLGGNDVLTPGAGTTAVDGGAGTDTLRLTGPWTAVSIRNGAVEAGESLALRFQGIERIVGSRGDDAISADDKIAMTLDGGLGDDDLFGGDLDDVLRGGAGDDFLWGWDGRDSVSGGRGDDDLLATDPGATLAGGAGADTFSFEPGFGTATVTDWDDGRDGIVLTAFDGLRFGDLTIADHRRGATVEARGETILLLGADAARLGPADFLFADG